MPAMGVGYLQRSLRRVLQINGVFKLPEPNVVEDPFEVPYDIWAKRCQLVCNPFRATLQIRHWNNLPGQTPGLSGLGIELFAQQHHRLGPSHSCVCW